MVYLRLVSPRLGAKGRVAAVHRFGLHLMGMVMGAMATLAVAFPLRAMADPPEAPIYAISELKLGALYHDVAGLWSGFSLERPAADANIELLFTPWAHTFGGYLRPAVGATLNFNGDTSKAYADLRWEVEAPSGVFFALGMGAAIHNGELGAVDEERKALGSRVLFHPSAELGYRFDGINSVSIFADHMSNGFTRQYNDGMDTIGIRYSHRFAAIASQASPETPMPMADFSGPYIGVFADDHWERADWYTTPTATASRNGFAASGFAGYSWQSGHGILGVEVDASPAKRSFAAGCDSPGISCQLDVRGVYSVRPRFGWVIDTMMIYGTGGLALTPWDNSVWSLATSRRLDHVAGLNYGVAIGAGIEYRLASSLNVRGEIMHYGLPGWDAHLPTAGPAATQFQSLVARVGVSWYFH
jgi:lipid A 3-O-deacylase